MEIYCILEVCPSVNHPTTPVFIVYFILVFVGALVHVFDRLLANATGHSTGNRSMWNFIFSWPVVAVIGPGLVFLGFGALSMTPPAVKFAQVCFAIGYLVILIKLAWWITFELAEPPWQRGLFVGFVFAATGVLWFASSTFAASKVPVLFISDVGALSVTAFAPNIVYATGTKFGEIEWMDGYIYVRLTIENTTDPLIQNLDLTVRVLDEDSILFDMGQFGSSIPGVEFHAPPMPDLKLTLQGTDGETSTVSSRDSFAIAFKGKKIPSLGQEYRLFCPRLIHDTPLIVVAATGSDKKQLTKQMKITGSYDTTIEGKGVHVTVNRELAVTR